MSDVPTVYTHHTQTGEVQELVERKQYDRLRAALKGVLGAWLEDASPDELAWLVDDARAALAGGASDMSEHPIIEADERDLSWAHGEIERLRAANDSLARTLNRVLAAPTLAERAALAGGAEPKGPQAPAMRIWVTNGTPGRMHWYMPGLPDGEHDLYCVPEAGAPMMRAESPENAQRKAADDLTAGAQALGLED